MRVLFVISSLGTGGAEVQLLQTLRGFDRTIIEPAVCALGPPGDLTERFREEDVPVFHLGRRGRLDFRVPLRLRTVIRRVGPDLIHSHMLYANLVVRLLKAAGIRVPLVSQDHGLSPWKGPVWSGIDRMTAPLVSAHVTVSECSREIRLKRERFPSEKTHVIHNGVDEKRFDPKAFPGPRWDDPTRIVGTVCSLKEVKDLHTLIHAIATVREEDPRVRLRLVGDGPQRVELEALASELGIADCTRFLGTREDIPRELSRMHVFVLPSIREDFPVSLLEAMSMERPSIGTEVGGIPEILQDGVNGYLVPPDRPDLLHRAIRSALDDPSEARRRGNRARATVLEKFTVDHQVRALMHLYRRILDGER